MRSVYLSLTVDAAEEAERIWALLSDGGQILMPMEETFFAHRFGQAGRQVRYVLDDSLSEVADRLKGCRVTARRSWRTT